MLATCKISIVITVFNEQENIVPLYGKIVEALDGEDFEIIFVDDGSTDGSLSKMLSLGDHRVKVLELRRNYGQSAALAAGIKRAAGAFIVTMDGDLQNDPADIPHMLALAEKGKYDLVAGIRANRKDDLFLRKIPSIIANRIIMRSTGVKIKDNGCALKIFRAEIIKGIGIYGEMHRFVSVLAALEGARIAQVEVRHHPRMHGRSKYGLSRTLRVISDLFLLVFQRSYLQRPMHFFGKWGGLIFVIGAVINFYLLMLKLAGEDIGGKPLLMLGVLMVIAGFQLITTGLIIELQMRTYYESQEKPHYQIRHIYQGGQEVS